MGLYNLFLFVFWFCFVGVVFFVFCVFFSYKPRGRGTVKAAFLKTDHTGSWTALVLDPFQCIPSNSH